MSIPDNETKHITKLYDSVLQYYFSQDQRKILDFEDRPFYNLVECLYGLMKSDPFLAQIYCAIPLIANLKKQLLCQVIPQKRKHLALLIISIQHLILTNKSIIF